MTRPRRGDVLVALLVGLLGFAAAVQVRSTQDDGVLASARQEDLVRILDDLSGRSDRLRTEVEDLMETQRQLESGTGGDDAALAEARRRTQLLGVLAGTVPARGPGVLLTVEDTSGGVRAAVLLDTLQELRAAGAEAVQLEGAGGPPVRVLASTAFVDVLDGIDVDGTVLRAPFTYRVVGDPGTLSSAVAIPGGVLDTVAAVGGQGRVEEQAELLVDAVAPLEAPAYAAPDPPR